ncbi:hypothetical protein CBL_21407, partial [Carabus blaptoides fortunei]
MSVSEISKGSDDQEEKIPNSRRFDIKYESFDDEEDLQTSSEILTSASITQQVSTISNVSMSETDNTSVNPDKVEETESSISLNKSLLDIDINIADLEGNDASQDASRSSSSNSIADQNTGDLPISPYYSKLLCAILDEAIDQIGILGCLEQLSPQFIKDIFGSLDERLQDYNHEDPLVDSETGVSYADILKEKEQNKIYEDGSFIRECLMYCRDSVMKTNSCQIFANLADAIKRKEREEDDLIAEERNNTALMEELEREIQTEDISSQYKLQELDEEIAELRDKLENKQMEHVLRERYCTDWAKSIVEQHGLKHKEKHEEMKQMKVKYDAIIEREIKANSEIELYFDEKDKKLEESLLEWQSKYDIDLEAGRNEIQILEAQTEEQEKEYMKVKEE